MKQAGALVRLCAAPALAWLGCAGCDPTVTHLTQELGETPSPYPVISSGLVFGHRMVGPDPVYWLDDDHVLFPGYEVVPPKGLPAQGRGELSEPGLYVWDITKNSHVRHSTLESPMWQLCFSDGYVYYSTRHGADGLSRDRYGGPFGQEKLIPNDHPSVPPPEWRRCLDSQWPRESYRQLGELQVGTIILRPGDGEIQFGGTAKPPRLVDRQNQLEAIRLVKEAGSAPIVLPVLNKEVMGGSVSSLSFAPFLNRYVLLAATPRSKDVFDPTTLWPSDQPRPVYLIGADGSVQSDQLPVGVAPARKVFPTRAGLFRVSNNAPTGNSIQAGGWILKDGKPLKLFDHIASAAGVSPDGCRIVYAVNDFSADHFRFLSAIDVCVSISGG
jgi:hypothetical protein